MASWLGSSEFGRRTGEQFPLAALLLPDHQDVEVSGAFLAFRERLTLCYPMKSHDRLSPTTRIQGSLYSSDRNFELSDVAFLMNVALSSIWASEWL